MKKFLQYLSVLAVIGFSGWAIYHYSLGPCEKTLEYGIDRFDTQFGVSKESFRAYLVEAEKVWEKAVGKEFFTYNPEASFKINLIYDERQRNIILKQREEFGLKTAEDILKQMDANLVLMKNEYEKKAAAHESSFAILQESKVAYESEVNKWNSRGGAPQKEFDDLEKKRLNLNAEVQAINFSASSLNSKKDELDILLKQRNVAAENYNKLVESYNKKYSSGLEFDQAEYTGKAINVYEFKNKDDLLMALTHELGHALGLSHVENSKSIMYYLSGGQEHLILSKEDLAELKSVCGVK